MMFQNAKISKISQILNFKISQYVKMSQNIKISKCLNLLSSSAWPFACIERLSPFHLRQIRVVFRENAFDDRASVFLRGAADSVVVLNLCDSQSSRHKSSHARSSIVEFDFDIVGGSVADETAVERVAGVNQLVAVVGAQHDEDRTRSRKTDDFLDAIVGEHAHVLDGAVVESAAVRAGAAAVRPNRSFILFLMNVTARMSNVRFII